jgi:hypothetical protein
MFPPYPQLLTGRADFRQPAHFEAPRSGHS